MPEPANTFDVRDLLLLVARSIRDRIRVLEQIDEADRQTGVVNKHTVRERLELLHLGVEVYLAMLGRPAGKHR
jgi:hypothetical protein